MFLAFLLIIINSLNESCLKKSFPRFFGGVSMGYDSPPRMFDDKPPA